MNRKKSFLLFGFILTFVVCGCGEQVNKEMTDQPFSVNQEEVVVKSAPAVKVSVDMGEKENNITGPIKKSTAKMLQPIRAAEIKEGEMLITDFESWPNNLGGELGVYGSLEPDWEEVSLYPISWIYEPITVGYDTANVHSGNSSFRLVNGLGLERDLSWGSFSIDLGPEIDVTTVPKKLESFDASGYNYLVFWAKGEEGGEKMELLVRDAHALNYSPQHNYKLPDLTTAWQKVVVPLEGLKGKVDLSQLDNISIGFGKDVGNMEGDIAYIDDFLFTTNP